MKVGDLVTVVCPLPDLRAGTDYTPWVTMMSLTGKVAPLVDYAGPGGNSKIFFDGVIRIICTDLLEVYKR